MMRKDASSISFKEKLAFGAGAFGKDFVYLFISLYIMFYFTDVLKIPAATAGTILLVVRLIDAGFDIPFGFLVDKTKTRWGRLRPYLLFGAIPYGIVAALLFYSPNLTESGKIFYAFTLYLLISILYSVISIPHAALNTIMTDNVKERAHLTKYLVLFSKIAITVAGTITVPLVGLFPSQQSGYFFMGALIGVIAIILILTCFKGTNEKVNENKQALQVPLNLVIKTVFSNGPYLILATSFLLAQLCLGVRSSALIYYFIYNVENANLFSVVSGIGGLIGIAITLVLPTIALRIGVRNFYLLVGFITILNFLLIYFTPTHLTSLVLILNILAATLTGLIMFAAWGSLPDAISYSVKQNGLHIEGVYYSLYNFIQKLGSSLSAGIAGFILAAYGYKTGGEPTASSLEGILMTSTFFPAICALIFTILMLFYKTNKAQLKKKTLESSVVNE